MLYVYAVLSEFAGPTDVTKLWKLKYFGEYCHAQKKKNSACFLHEEFTFTVHLILNESTG
jgi:hypothetical protein